ncbi:peptidylprolyl isomerase [Sphingomonas sp. MAH-20]|uniref:Parvulin-like PPIase n=1 Tax=Sphingomonas horti TaxID=2682842 RepID=A0A6I4IWT9_9SPHN|nr:MULTISPECIES: peptidyl-prolyl cis-trans isomerase [Sphingomonas]MBA2920378.1 SurA N-terminal domain-containing protein [Sphingomonas sp. CGMCC 1.13658]MVO76632.1 peptidylprolyl isomerase [Sphingomonas horti]
MLNSFRRLSNSKIGLVALAIVGAMIGLGFVMMDMQNITGGMGGTTGDTVAKVGRQRIGYVELQDRVRRAFEAARQQQPELTMADFVRQGSVDQILQQLADGAALEQFAKQQGFGVSRKMEDAQIASAPAFRGLNGRFDQSAFEAFLYRQRVSEKQVRADLARDLYLTQLLVPVTGASLAPATLTLPYASMLLEQRSGRAQLVPVSAMKAPPPSDAELQAYYRKNIARYTTPERRVARYALIDRADFEAAAHPSEAEIAQAYEAKKADYAPKETRTITQVILPSEAAARDLAAKVSAGTSMAEAARAAGLESVTLNDQTRDAYAGVSSPAIAAAVFSTPQGKVAAPARSGLGWHVVRVDSITAVPGKTLDQVRGELTEQLKKAKSDQTLADAIAKIEDSIADGSTFDEVVAAAKLKPVTTPALLKDGRNPDAPDAPVAPELAAVMKSAFGMESGDDPVTEQVVPDKLFAVVKTDSVVPPTPRPLASIRDKVAADFAAERALAASRQTADAIAAKLNAGTPLAQAVNAAGTSLPAAAALGGRRGELLRDGAQPQPQMEALFALTRGKARVVEAPDKSGWYVVTLDDVIAGNAASQPQLIEATRVQFSPVLGQEYGQQLATAARKAVGVEINPAAVARLKAELIGGAGGR